MYRSTDFGFINLKSGLIAFYLNLFSLKPETRRHTHKKSLDVSWNTEHCYWFATDTVWKFRQGKNGTVSTSPMNGSWKTGQVGHATSGLWTLKLFGYMYVNMEQFRSRRSLRVAIAVFKVLVSEGVCRWPSPLLLSSIDKSKKMNSMNFSVFLFCTGRIASSCIYFVPIFFLNQYQK